MKEILNFFFKGEVPISFLDQKEKSTTVGSTKTVAESEGIVELNELEIKEDYDVKLRSGILRLFSRIIAGLLLFCVVGVLAYPPLFGREAPAIINYVISGLLGCIVGSVGTYLGVKNADQIVSKN